MQIQINVPHRSSSGELDAFIEKRVQEVLQPFESHLTRVEVHLKELNGDPEDHSRRCSIEARPRGLDPIAAEADGENDPEAVRQAIDKLRRALDHRVGKLNARKH